MVYVLGLRRSYAVAAYLAYALPRVGRSAIQLTGLGGGMAEQARAVGPRDLLIAISFPPYAADTLAVCEQVHAAGVRRLALTDTVLSPVARDAALVLQVNDAELQGFRSLTSALCLAQSLAMGIAFAGRRRRVPARLPHATTWIADRPRHATTPHADGAHPARTDAHRRRLPALRPGDRSRTRHPAPRHQRRSRAALRRSSRDRRPAPAGARGSPSSVPCHAACRCA